MSLIGRVVATEKVYTTIDEFGFWTNIDLILNPFDVVTVEHVNGSKTYAVIQEIHHITDSSSFLANFISNDFGDVDSTETTYRISMNYVKAKVVGNSKNIFIPVQSGSKVYMANAEDIKFALGLDNIKNPLSCGYLKMYENSGEHNEIVLPVNIDTKFLIGPEGAHLNISGISGLAAKTSYAMFLLKSIQDKYIKESLEEKSEREKVAFVVFNVKGKDLLAIDKLNDFEGNVEKANEVKKIYDMLGMSHKPFENVTYFYPSARKRPNSYVPTDIFDEQEKTKQAYKYTFTYEWWL